MTTPNMIKSSVLAVLMSLAGLGCSSGNAKYYHVTVSQASALTGTDCPGVGDDVNTYTGIDSDGTWVIYSGPNNQYLLEGAFSGDLLVGTLAGSTYTFTGTVVNDAKGTGTGAVEVIVTSKTTVTITTTGPGFTGTITSEIACTSSNNDACTSYSADGHSTDCTSNGSIVGTQVSNVQEEESQGATPASQLTTGGGNAGNGNGNGNNGGNGSNGGNGNTTTTTTTGSTGTTVSLYVGSWSGSLQVSNSKTGASGTVSDNETITQNGSASVGDSNFLSNAAGFSGCAETFAASSSLATGQTGITCTDNTGNAWTVAEADLESTGTGSIEVLFEAQDPSGDVLTVQGTLTN